MKKLLTIIIFLIIFLPMIIYLNPFLWGMRRMPQYNPSVKTTKLIDALNKKYNLEIEVGYENIDSLWYFRDFNNNQISELEDFTLRISDNNVINNSEILNKYTTEFLKSFEHKRYFDSLKVTINSDSLIFKSKIK